MVVANRETGGKPLPSQAQVIVIGAGVIGCSVAYHLTKMGCRDVVLLERQSVACGTSWHSLGVVGLLRAGPTLTRLAQETARLLPELERETGKSTGYAARGSVNVTSDPARMTQFRRVADVGGSVGLEVHEIDAAEAKRLWPLMDSDGLIGGIHLPTEGQCNPMDLTQALVTGARNGGARIVENVAVTDLDLREGRVVAVETSAGRIACEQVVNCTGLWGRDFVRKKGAHLPLQGVEHNYLVTEFIEDLPEGMPILRDPDMTLTVREDARQFSFGFNERLAKLFGTEGVPEDFAFEPLPPDWDDAAPYIEDAMRRVPLLREVGIRLFLCGPESVTPDTRYMLGPLPGFENYFVAAGFSGVGIGSSGGAGRALAQWLLEGRPADDLWEVDVRRMMPFQSNPRYLEQRATEAQGMLFAMNWPHRQYESARGIRRSPLHEPLRAAGACFGCVAGWEVADWFAPPGVEPKHHYSFERPAWFPHARAEARAAMAAVALADRSPMAKLLVTGAGAESALSAICANDPAVAVGSQVLTPLLDDRGGIEAFVTLARQEADAFLLLSEAPTQTWCLDLLRRRLAGRADVSVVDVTSAFAVVDVVGPEAGATLAGAGWREAGSGDCDPAAEIGCITALLLREPRYGVPAWSAVVPSEFAGALFETLRDAGSDRDPRLLGRHAQQSLITLAGRPLWSQALTTEVTPIEAGLVSFVDLSGRRDFVGRAVCERQHIEGVTRRLAAFVLEDPEVVLLGHEPILRDGEPVGAIDQAAYALVSSGAIGLGYVACTPGAATTDFGGGNYEIVVAGRRVAARLDRLVGEGPLRQASETVPPALESVP